MKEFKSAFKPAIEEYLEFRSAMGYCNEHEQQLRYFDKYCYEHFPEQTELTKEVVRGWFYDEIASGRACLSSKATTIRLFARYLGSSAYVLPMNCVPKTPDYLPYILTDEELAALFQAADTMEYKNDPFFQKTASTLLRLLYACGLRPNEGRNLKVEHINFQTGELFITKTKRRKERIVVVSGDMLLLLKKYRLQRAVFDKGNEYFFIHTDSTAIKSWQLTALVKSCWIAAHPGIDPKVLPRVRPYDLRHRFGSMKAGTFMRCCHIFGPIWGTKSFRILPTTSTSCRNALWYLPEYSGIISTASEWGWIYGNTKPFVYPCPQLLSGLSTRRTEMQPEHDTFLPKVSGTAV